MGIGGVQVMADEMTLSDMVNIEEWLHHTVLKSTEVVALLDPTMRQLSNSQYQNPRLERVSFRFPAVQEGRSASHFYSFLISQLRPTDSADR